MNTCPPPLLMTEINEVSAALCLHVFMLERKTRPPGWAEVKAQP